MDTSEDAPALSPSAASPASQSAGVPAPFPTLLQAQNAETKFTETCEKQLPPTEILVTTELAPVTEVNNEDIRSLTTQEQEYRQGHFTLGLTSEKYRLSVNSKLTTLTDPRSLATCARVALDVSLSEPYHKVSIGREFSPGTCIFNEIRRHEYRHVAVNQNSIQWAKTVVEGELKTQFGNRVFYGDPTTLRQQIDDAVTSYWMPRVEQLHAEVQKQQQLIDTPEEYARLGAVCDGAANRVIAATPNLADLR